MELCRNPFIKAAWLRRAYKQETTKDEGSFPPRHHAALQRILPFQSA